MKKQKSDNMSWYLFGVLSVIWIYPMIGSFVNVVVQHFQLMINDILRADQKSQSILDSEYPRKEEFGYFGQDMYGDGFDPQFENWLGYEGDEEDE